MPPLPVHSRPPSQVTLARRLVTFIAGKRSKWLVLAMWLAVLSGAGPLSGKLQGITKNDATSYLPAGAESTKVIAELSRSGSNQSQSTVDVLYVRSGGLTEADQSRVRADRQRLAQLFPTQPAATLIPSRDGAAALLSQTLPPDNGNSTTLHNTISELRTMARVNDPAGLAIDVTGQAAILSDFVDGFGKVDLTVLLAALAVVTILLLLIYRSPFLWLLPLLVAASGYTLAAAAVYLLGSRTGLVINSESAGILSVLVLGAGTDYALLLIARYREELRRHVDRHVAMQEALLRAGPAILASAATVTIGLLCLVVAELNSDRGLGPVAAVGIVSVFVAMTTLLPVLLVVMSRWVFWPFSPRYGSRSADEHSVWTRLAAGIARRPRRTWLATSAGLVLLGIGLTQLHQGLRTGDALRPAPDSVLGERQLA